MMDGHGIVTVDGDLSPKEDGVQRQPKNSVDCITLDIGHTILQCVKMITSKPKFSEMGQLLEYKMSLPEYTLAELGDHSDSRSCWIALSDKIYDVTDFLRTHPGGQEIILENGGTDATVPFDSKGHSSHAYAMLEKYYIGDLVESDRRHKT